jgi:tRNA pseudouridine13 synthase
MPLPYLTKDFPGIGGRIKQRPEDFFVQEVPLYEPSGHGEHVYAEIQKIGLTTFDALHRIADALRIPSRDIGYAGMKDARAVSRQVLSIRGATEQAVMGLHIPNLSVMWASRHDNKLRLGHLAGNRFAIKIRDVTPTDVVKLRPVVNLLERRGVPNYFGEQRFGRRNNNDQLGAALLRNDNRAVLSLLLGRGDPRLDDPYTLEARAAFDAGELDKAMHAYPRRHGMERRILARLIKTHKPGAAVRAVDEKLRRLWVSALQSKLFNDVLARRLEMGAIDRLLDGDFAMKHENGAGFMVESAAAEQSRADVWEISPTGPLVGFRMTMPEGEPRRIEEEVMAAAGVSPGDFKQPGKHRVKGTRRPLRVRPTDVRLEGGADEHGPFITVAFTLPSGSFATMFLRELMKFETRPKRSPDAADEIEEEIADEAVDGGDDDEAAHHATSPDEAAADIE